MKPYDRQALLKGFQEEAGEHLQAIAKALLSIERRDNVSESIEDILRRLHSLKGSARIVGAADAAALAHSLETVMAEVRGEHLSLAADVMDSILDAVDIMKSCIEAVSGGTAVEGAKETLSKLFSLAASARSHDENLQRCFPGLDPEIREVLTEFQKSAALFSLQTGKKCWEIEFEAGIKEFAQRVDQGQRELEVAGDIIGLSGLTAKSEGRLRFKFLLSTRWAEDTVRTLCQKASLVLGDPTVPPKPAESEAGSSARKQEFAKKMAALTKRYINEGPEKVDEFTVALLSLERKPGDVILIDNLFRQAHNFKGSGAICGLPSISLLSGHIENLLDSLRNRKLKMTPQITEALLRGVDGLREIFQKAAKGDVGAMPPPPALQALQAALKEEALPSAGVLLGETLKLKAPARESIRVALLKLDRLVNLAGEMTIGKNSREAAVKAVEARVDEAKEAVRLWQKLHEDLAPGFGEGFTELGARLARLQGALETLWNRFSTTTLQAAANVEALQDEIMRIRMVPVSTLFDSAPRLIRDLTQDRVRQVELRVSGEDTGMDKRVLELMTDPLMHLIRNAVDHGIEPADERALALKPREGILALSAEHRGSHIVITVSDNGRGMDPKRLAAKAVEKGLITAAEAHKLSDEQAYGFIFHPGFSTKEQVTEISGRGVGMDVVLNNVETLKGHIEIESSAGLGTTFRILLPMSLSVIQIVLIECGGQTFCLQTSAIIEVVRAAESEIETEEGNACFPYRGKTMPVVRLAGLLGLPGPAAEGKLLTMIIAKGSHGAMGFIVDRALEEQAAVLKEMGKLFCHAPHVSGGTILPDGRVAVILDLASIIAAAVRGAGRWDSARPAAAIAASRKTLLVVDDSLTARELLRVLLETAGYDVLTARHGLEAWSVLETSPVDLVVSDIQMPEMDGYELTARIKASSRFAALPVVLISALSKDEEKLKGLRAGADAYIVKGAFDQTGLLGRITELVGRNA